MTRWLRQTFYDVLKHLDGYGVSGSKVFGLAWSAHPAKRTEAQRKYVPKEVYIIFHRPSLLLRA